VSKSKSKSKEKAKKKQRKSKDIHNSALLLKVSRIGKFRKIQHTQFFRVMGVQILFFRMMGVLFLVSIFKST